MERRTLQLLLLTTGLAVVEAAALQGIGFTSAIPVAPEVSATPTFAVFHDLRWVWTFAWSPWSTAWMLVALFVFRTGTNALIVRLAWPAGVPWPSLPTLLRRSALFTLLAVVALSPWATYTFVSSSAGFSPIMLAAIIGSILTALVLPPGIVTGQWWRRVLPLRTMGWTLLSWVELMAAALAITFAPAWVTVLAAAAGGLFNGWIWQRLVASAIRAGEPRWTIPGLPIVGIAVSGGLVVLSGFAFAGALIGGSSQTIPHAQAATPGGNPPVLYVPGFDSSYDGGAVKALPSGFRTVHFSYRGLAPDGTPLPYGAQDTHQSLQLSAQRLATQVQALHQATGRPVEIVAASEGTMVSRTYFATVAHPPVDTYVQLSPLIRPARVWYPPAGQDGSGYIAGWEARGILSLLRTESSGVDLTANMPFLRSLVDGAPLYRDQTMCPIPGVRTFLFFPLEGALTVYRGPLARTDWTTLPAFHGNLLEDAQVQQEVAKVLAGQPHHFTGWEVAFQVIRGAAGAWQSPALPLQDHAAWHAQPNSDPAFGHYACPAPSGT